jgi:cyclic dehypoxanthinyl futalosine synthase
MTATPYATPPVFAHIDALDPGLLRDVAQGHARLTPEQGLELFQRAPLTTLGRYADMRCRSLHGDALRTYVIDRNINYTNVCSAKCIFCAFRRDGHEDDAYTLEYNEIFDKIEALSAIGGTQILMQGGMNPELPLDWYLELLAGIKQRFPHIHVHAFSPPEFIEFVNFFDPPGDALEDKIRWVMVRLREAGLDSLPGGGGEIFAPAVRRKIGLGKCDAEAWLTTMYVAHSLGMFTSATMMFGHIEGVADRVHHMRLVRDWQDRALRHAANGDPAVTVNRSAPVESTQWGHYKAFISWPFQRENTPLGRLPEWGQTDPAELDQTFPGDAIAKLDGSGTKDQHPLFGRRLRMSGSTDYLRTQALSRLMLDNVFSIGASWVTMGPHIGQVALQYGANDMGSVMMEENVVSAAGTTYCLDEPVLCRLIRDAGFVPAQRDNVYDILQIHDRAEAPDLLVDDWSTHRAQKLVAQNDKPSNAPVTLTASAAEQHDA